MTSRPPAKKASRPRKSPEERRAEILATAVSMAMADGLESVTLRSVSDALGITGGLVGHYFPAVDDLLGEAFTTIAQGEVDQLFIAARDEADPLATMRSLLALLLSDERDPISLLWIDAWHAGRRRPTLRAHVDRLSRAWLDLLHGLVEDGRSAGQFSVDDPSASATRILALVDGHNLKAAMRGAADYRPVREMVVAVSERELGLEPGALA